MSLDYLRIESEYLNTIDKLSHVVVGKAEEVQQAFDKTPNKCVQTINSIIDEFEIPERLEITTQELDQLWEDNIN